MKKLGVLFIAMFACLSLAWSQADQAQQPFRAGINLGTEVLMTGLNPDTGKYDLPQSWSVLGFQPDLAFGKFGIGLNLTFHFQLYPADDPTNAVKLYEGDWVADTIPGIVDIYLPKLLYLRYGLKGVDPLFVKAGSIADLTLGNGFIMGNYSNMSYFPEVRTLGVNAGLDSSLFKLPPFIGGEVVIGNLARLDVIGGHLLARPMSWSDIPILKDLQVGLTVVHDSATGSTKASTTAVTVYGFDFLVPVLSSPMLSLAGFGETSFEPNSSAGTMVGFGGRLIGLFTYGFQLRILGAGFVPNYFDTNYDMYKKAKAEFMATTATGDGIAGWYASIGTSLLGDKLAVSAALDGPFGITSPQTTDQADWPHLRAVAHLGEGLLPGIYADATYEKYFLGAGRKGDFVQDLIDPYAAIVGMDINYKTGSSVLTLRYNVKYVEGATPSPWKVTSSLQASLKF